MTTHVNGNGSVQASPGSAIYVDTENLRDSEHAQNIVARIIANWPAEHPRVASLSLYVRADKEALWRLWAEATYPDLLVRVRGIQHFSNHRAKNSADLAVTADAVADLITGQTATVAVVSNDSDFGSLFVKVNELSQDAGTGHIPFLWVTAPDAGGVSDEIDQFIPAQFRWDLSTALSPPTPIHAASPRSAIPTPKSPEPVRPSPVEDDAQVANESIATELIRRLPVGRFKVADAHQVVRARWPEHPAAADASKMGQFLLNELWPTLQKRGVTMPRTSSPRTYEVTQAAKDSLGKPAIQSSPEGNPPSEVTSVQLAATVASGIAEEVFKASDAQSALKDLRPNHPASSYTPAQFGTWFAKQLWPVMEQHGVVLASEKPRRYEITPDARHRLISLA